MDRAHAFADDMMVALRKCAHISEQRTVRVSNCVASTGCSPKARRERRRAVIAEPSHRASDGEWLPCCLDKGSEDLIVAGERTACRMLDCPLHGHLDRRVHQELADRR